MIRGLVYILISILVLTFIRMVAGILFKSVGAMMEPDSAAGPGPSGPSAKVPLGGELKRDPVCGTFVPTSTSLKKLVHGEAVYFCSPACRDKHVA